MHVYYFHNIGAAFAVPKSLKLYIYKYRLYCAGATFAVPKYSDFTSMNIVCMLALHLQCQNILNFRYVNIVCMHVGGAFAVHAKTFRYMNIAIYGR